jgi:hypothetical protein
MNCSDAKECGSAEESQAELGLKHGCVAAGFSAVIVPIGGVSAQSNQRAVSGSVELSANIADAIGFEPDSVWPVISMLWDIHGIVGRYDLGVIGVWMAGIGKPMYVAGI